MRRSAGQAAWLDPAGRPDHQRQFRGTRLSRSQAPRIGAPVALSTEPRTGIHRHTASVAWTLVGHLDRSFLVGFQLTEDGTQVLMNAIRSMRPETH